MPLVGICIWKIPDSPNRGRTLPLSLSLFQKEKERSWANDLWLMLQRAAGTIPRNPRSAERMAVTTWPELITMCWSWCCLLTPVRSPVHPERNPHRSTHTYTHTHAQMCAVYLWVPACSVWLIAELELTRYSTRSLRRFASVGESGWGRVRSYL